MKHGTACPCYYCRYHMAHNGGVPTPEDLHFISSYNFSYLLVALIGDKWYYK